jgi:hypothetical protein
VANGSLYLRAFGWWAFSTERLGINLRKGSQLLLAYQIQSAFRTWIIRYENCQSKRRLAEENAKNLIMSKTFNRWKAVLISKLKFKLRMATLAHRLDSFAKVKKKKIFIGNRLNLLQIGLER